MSLIKVDAAKLLALEEAKQREAAKSYLDSTDWFVTRLAETGKPVPDDVAAKREAARKSANT